jgi:hypothetical protein
VYGLTKDVLVALSHKRSISFVLQLVYKWIHSRRIIAGVLEQKYVLRRAFLLVAGLLE